MAAANAVGGEARRQVALVAVDPVPDELDPAVAAPGLERGVLRQLVRLHLVGVVADVPLGAPEVAPAADQPRQVVAVVDPPGVRGAAGVTDQQRAPVAVVDRLLLGLLVPHGAEVVEPEVAVRVDQARHDPAVARGLRAGWALVGDAAVHDVQITGLAVGQDRAGELERGHADRTGAGPRVYGAGRSRPSPARGELRARTPVGLVPHVRRPLRAGQVAPGERRTPRRPSPRGRGPTRRPRAGRWRAAPGRPAAGTPWSLSSGLSAGIAPTRVQVSPSKSCATRLPPVASSRDPSSLKVRDSTWPTEPGSTARGSMVMGSTSCSPPTTSATTTGPTPPLVSGTAATKPGTSGADGTPRRRRTAPRGTVAPRRVTRAADAREVGHQQLVARVGVADEPRVTPGDAHDPSRRRAGADLELLPERPALRQAHAVDGVVAGVDPVGAPDRTGIGSDRLVGPDMPQDRAAARHEREGVVADPRRPDPRRRSGRPPRRWRRRPTGGGP